MVYLNCFVKRETLEAMSGRVKQVFGEDTKESGKNKPILAERQEDYAKLQHHLLQKHHSPGQKNHYVLSVPQRNGRKAKNTMPWRKSKNKLLESLIS